MDEKRFSEIAGIFPTRSEVSDFNPGRPRKLTLAEAFDDYDLSHDKLRYSDIEDEEEDPVVDSTIDDSDSRHLQRLAKSMGIVLSVDERGLKPLELIDARLQRLSDIIDKISGQSDRMVSDPWDDYISPSDATSLLNRFENRIGDAVHLVVHERLVHQAANADGVRAKSLALHLHLFHFTHLIRGVRVGHVVQVSNKHAERGDHANERPAVLEGCHAGAILTAQRENGAAPCPARLGAIQLAIGIIEREFSIRAD